ncbi:hypothetical protein I312_104772 [Cryptococcus bacillisporus CA1280]|uniref:uncharacterized protein n=1 Tax=Cryptococcus bacillisporus CA1280 TaxID=1296109 RepID=UPI003369B731
MDQESSRKGTRTTTLIVREHGPERCFWKHTGLGLSVSLLPSNQPATAHSPFNQSHSSFNQSHSYTTPFAQPYSTASSSPPPATDTELCETNNLHSPSNAVVFPHHLNSPPRSPPYPYYHYTSHFESSFAVLLPAVSVILQITSSTQIIKGSSLSLSRS